MCSRFGNCIWDTWSEDEDDGILLWNERRQYNLYVRIDHLNKWDDIDFFRRFRLRKETVVNLLDMIYLKLQNRTDRSVNIYSFFLFFLIMFSLCETEAAISNQLGSSLSAFDFML